MDAHRERENQRVHEIANLVALLARASSHGRMKIKAKDLMQRNRKAKGGRKIRGRDSDTDDWDKFVEEAEAAEKKAGAVG